MEEKIDVREDKFFNSAEYRQQILKEIRGDESRMRMQSSLQDLDIYNGKIRPYVIKYLKSRFSDNTVKEMPIVASLNITRKLVDQKASLYKTSPDREFSGLPNKIRDQVENIYSTMQMDSKLLESNRMYELQSRQSHVMVIPKNGKLKARVLKNHQLNVVTAENDPESASVYIISSFDKYMSNLYNSNSDYSNQNIADPDDYKSNVERYIVWSAKYHFLMDGHGKIITEESINPISPVIPIIEVAPDSKDYEYWIQGVGSEEDNKVFSGGGELSNFTTEFNAAMSSLGQIVNMSSFAQAYLKAPESLQPVSVVIGPNHILRLITDPTSGNDDTEFGYASPNADIVGAQSYTLSLLSLFLSSQGLDPKSITGQTESQNFSSGIERLLAMVSQFESSKESQAVFINAEQRIFEIIKAWCNLSIKADILDKEFQISLPEDATLSITYTRPEAIQTDTEKLDVIERKIDLGLMSKVDAIMELYDKSFEEAKQKLLEIDEYDMLTPKPLPIMPIIPPPMIED